MREVTNPLVARLRVGSVLTTRSGTSYRVIEPVVQVASNGSVVPGLVVQMTQPGRSPRSVLMALGILGRIMRSGGRHKPGTGATIDWSRVERREMMRQSTFLRGQVKTTR